MGRGITAAIPIVFTPDLRSVDDEKYFAQGFFDNFDSEEIDGTKVCTIKESLLINNYKHFLTEFYDLIGENFYERAHLDAGSVPDANNFGEFSEIFNRETRDGYVPFVSESYMAFSATGCECYTYWLFYSGSYKAYLEEYDTLMHFEKILAKTMKNPLANAVKFGIYG